MTMSFSTTGQQLFANGASSGADQNAGNVIRRSRPLSLASPTASPNGSLDIGSGGFRAGGSGSGNSTSRRHEEELINAYEAEEERIINVLSRKLEQVCSSFFSTFSSYSPVCSSSVPLLSLLRFYTFSLG